MTDKIIFFFDAVEIKKSKQYYNLALKEKEKKEYHKAIINLNKALEANPKFVEAYQEQACIQLSIYADHKSVISNFDEIIKLDSKHCEAYRRRAYSKMQMKDYNGAIGDYSKAILISPKNDLCYFRRGESNFKIKNYEDARLDFYSAHNLNKTNSEYIYWMGRAALKINYKEEGLKNIILASEMDCEEARSFVKRIKY